MSDSIKLITLDPQALTKQWSELRAALDQTETLMKALNVPIPGAKVVMAATPQVSMRVAARNLTQAVKEACLICGAKGNFTKYDVEAVLDSEKIEYSTASVSAIMSMASTASEIIQVEKGVGGKPSTYRLP